MLVLFPALRALRRALILAPFVAVAARAQATRLIDPVDPVYLDLNRLAAAGYLRTYVAGVRPWSRAQIARWLDEAEARLATVRDATREDERARNLNAALLGVVARARERLDIHLVSVSGGRRLAAASSPMRAAGLELTRSDSPTRWITVGNGLGIIDAFVNPLLSNQQ